MTAEIDVIVVGAGNAALCAALAAAEAGARVLVLERAPEAESGGNSRFTAGAFRCVYDGVDDLRALMPDLTDAEVARTDFGTYTEAQFFDDMGRSPNTAPIRSSANCWSPAAARRCAGCRRKGVRFMPIWGRQAFASTAGSSSGAG
jgi:tricarballylate dehydrogenase